MDLPSLTDGLAYANSGFDFFRSAVGLMKDIQGVLPIGEKKDAIGASLAQAERQMKLAEAQIAKGLGYSLCDCAYPPTPMLLVGRRINTFGIPEKVRECPACLTNDAKLEEWVRTVGSDAGQKYPRLLENAPSKIRPANRRI